MPGNYQKPTDKKHKDIPFKIIAGEKEYAGTITVEGIPPAFGIPNTFFVRLPGETRKTLSIYMGKWQMPGASEVFIKALGAWIEDYYG
jgi:hypothetical protein